MSYLARTREIKKYDVRSAILCGLVARGQAKPGRIRDIWMTPEELEDMAMAKTGFLVDSLLEGRVLQDDGTAAAAREKLVASLKRLKARRLKSGVDDPER